MDIGGRRLWGMCFYCGSAKAFFSPGGESTFFDGSPEYADMLAFARETRFCGDSRAFVSSRVLGEGGGDCPQGVMSDPSARYRALWP